MSKRGAYAVRISGLSEGEHDFSFDLGQEFFASLEQSEIENGRLNAGIILEKKPGVFTLHFRIEGVVEVACDRCLKDFMMAVETRNVLYVKTGENPGEIEDDVVMIHPEDHEIEVGQYLYEFIILSLPVKKVHPDNSEGISGCDPEMVERIREHQGERESDEVTDPRWEALRNMIKNTDSNGTS